MDLSPLVLSLLFKVMGIWQIFSPEINPIYVQIINNMQSMNLSTGISILCRVLTRKWKISSAQIEKCHFQVEMLSCQILSNLLTIGPLIWHVNQHAHGSVCIRPRHFCTSCHNQLLPVGFEFLLAKHFQKCVQIVCRCIKNRVAYFFGSPVLWPYIPHLRPYSRKYAPMCAPFLSFKWPYKWV